MVAVKAKGLDLMMAESTVAHLELYLVAVSAETTDPK